MSLKSVQAAIRFSGDPQIDPRFERWVTAPGYEVVDTSIETADAVSGLIAALYNGSATARSYLEQIAGTGLIRIGNANIAQFVKGGLFSPNYPYIRFSADFLVDTINVYGERVTLPPIIVLAHEIAHWATKDGDEIPDPLPNAVMNQSDFDYYGSNMPHETAMLDELVASGIVSDAQDYHRAGYIAAARNISGLWNEIDIGVNYALGGRIEVFRRGNFTGDNDVIDVSQQHYKFAIAGLSGDDKIKGSEGDDLIWGGTGDDLIDGFSGYDTLFGGAGQDKIKLGTTTGAAYGEEGNDVLFSGDEGGLLDGGEGDDTLVGTQSFTNAVGGAGDDHIFLKSDAWVEAGEGDDSVFIDGAYAALAYITIDFGEGADWLHLSNDGIYSALDAPSLVISIFDAEVHDRIYWDGHRLTGGALTVVKEGTSNYGEGSTGALTWIDDATGVTYDYREDEEMLFITLPDSQSVSVFGFHNGDMGINLTGYFRYYTEDDHWSELPRVNTANMDIPSFGCVNARPAGPHILEALSVRLAGFTNPGAFAAPEPPVPADFPFL